MATPASVDGHAADMAIGQQAASGAHGTAVINGAVVVEGNTEFSQLTGNLQVVYNSDLLSRINTAPPYVNGLAGTWKDF